MDSGSHHRIGIPATSGVVRGSWASITAGDLASEILSRLPTKSVVRFRCVCRRWFSLTTEDSFIKSHTLLHPHPLPAGIIVKPTFSAPLQSHPFPGFPSPGLPDPSLSFLSDYISAQGLRINQVYIKGTSNGLVLFDTFIQSPHPFPPYIICNPITEDFRCIPQPQPSSIKAAALFFDPSSQSHCRLHYSVICISAPFFRPSPPAPIESEFWVYSSLTQSWKPSIKTTSLPFFPARFSEDNSPSVSCGGAVHWSGILHARLVSFEVEGEHLRVTPFPPLPPLTHNDFNVGHRTLLRFGEFRGRLHLMETYSRDANLLRIFERENDSEWKFLYHVRLDAFLTMNPVTCDINFVVADPLCIVWQEVEEREDGGRDSEALLLLRLEGELTSYNLCSKVHRKESRYCLTQTLITLNAEGSKGIEPEKHPRDVLRRSSLWDMQM